LQNFLRVADEEASIEEQNIEASSACSL